MNVIVLFRLITFLTHPRYIFSDVVSYLVDKGHALERKDALDLGRILASHFNLFQYASHTGKEQLLEDDDSYYQFNDECIQKWGDKKKWAMQKSLANSARL